MSAHIIRGNALALPLADDTVDLVVTSPPYFGLRSYQDGGEHYDGQIGSEATPAEFVDALLAATREMVRVVKPSGSIWVNLGDKYSQPGKGERNMQGVGGSIVHKVGRAQPNRSAVGLSYGAPAKSLIGVPWRYALRCIDDLGLILRAEVIWSKPNGLPESVTDRVRRSHETWFHFTKEPRYYSAVDEIREPHQATKQGRSTEGWRPGPSGQNRGTEVGRTHADGDPLRYFALSPLGKLPGSVWEISTQPLKVPAELGIDHFAAFPMEWPRRIIQGWSPAGVCTACGEGRRPVSAAQRPALDLAWREPQGQRRDGSNGLGGSSLGTPAAHRERTITGYACACPDTTAPTTPSVILDPFGGTGTTALLAKALGRHGISVDMSADYCRLAQWRTTDPGELARAMQVEKPAVQIEGQISMLDLLNEEGGAA